jgi:hypothetical protein
VHFRRSLVFTCINRVPEDGTPVPKNVGVDAYHETYFMICIELHLTGYSCGNMLNAFLVR